MPMEIADVDILSRPLPEHAQRAIWEGRTARRPAGPSTGPGRASSLSLLTLALVTLTGHATIPPELREYVGKRQRAVVERGGEDAAQGAVFSALMVSASEQAEAEAKAAEAAARAAAAQEPARGAGNASAYVAPAVVPQMALGARLTGKVKINVVTGVVESLGGAGAEDDETTIERGAAGESPWAQETEVRPIAAADLPSSHAPVATRAAAAAAEEKPGARRSGVWAAALGGAAVLVAIAVVRFGPEGAGSGVVSTSGAMIASVSVSAIVSAPSAVMVAPSVSVQVVDPVVPAVSATAEIDAGAPPPAVPTAVVAPVKVKSTGKQVDDIYDAAGPSPAKTVEAAVVAAPSLMPTPVPPPSRPSALPFVEGKPDF